MAIQPDCMNRVASYPSIEPACALRRSVCFGFGSAAPIRPLRGDFSARLGIWQHLPAARAARAPDPVCVDLGGLLDAAARDVEQRGSIGLRGCAFLRNLRVLVVAAMQIRQLLRHHRALRGGEVATLQTPRARGADECRTDSTGATHPDPSRARGGRKSDEFKVESFHLETGKTRDKAAEYVAWPCALWKTRCGRRTVATGRVTSSRRKVSFLKQARSQAPLA